MRYGVKAVLILVGAVALSGRVATAQTQGQKQTAEVVKRGNDVVDAIGQTKMQIQKTLNEYNTILKPTTADRSSAYKSLLKSIDDTEKKAQNTRERVDAMQKDADTLFGSWNASLAEITDTNLRARSQERLNETRQRYDQILKTGKLAGEDFKSFVANLRNQVNYLGHDLNASAVASLEPDAKKLNAQGEETFKKIDATTKELQGYIRSLQPQ